MPATRSRWLLAGRAEVEHGTERYLLDVDGQTVYS